MAYEITDEDPDAVQAVRDDLRAGLRAVLVQGDGGEDLSVRKVVATEADAPLVLTEGVLTSVAWEVDYDLLRLDAFGYVSHDGEVLVERAGTLSGVTIHDARSGLFHRHIDWYSALQGAGVLTAARPQGVVDGDDLTAEVEEDVAMGPTGDADDSFEPPPSTS